MEPVVETNDFGDIQHIGENQALRARITTIAPVVLDDFSRPKYKDLQNHVWPRQTICRNTYRNLTKRPSFRKHLKRAIPRSPLYSFSPHFKGIRL